MKELYLNDRSIFSDDEISHGVSPIESKDGIRKGWRDILLIDFDPVRPYRIT
ncbi:MAG: hypothetical protein HGN29_00535 [Asgard group archaeon]|nr:hypothetical protein [Asgard group archaeon]